MAMKVALAGSEGRYSYMLASMGQVSRVHPFIEGMVVAAVVVAVRYCWMITMGDVPFSGRILEIGQEV